MKTFFWLIIWFIPIVAFSQEKATFSFNEKPLPEALFIIEKQYNVRFSYQANLLQNYIVSLICKEQNIIQILTEIEQQLPLHFTKVNNRYYLVKPLKSNLNSTQYLSEITINNYLTRGISKSKTGYFNINPNKLNILPGLIEPDVFESIQQLPGVISPNETATGLIVRGGTIDQNRTLWDGINIYHNGHLFGMISAFNPNVVKETNFYNKGTNPKYGERISSVIDLKTSGKVAKKIAVIFSLNGINADLVIEAPIIKNKLSIQSSIRRAYTDIIQTPTYNKLAKKVFQNTKLSNENNFNNVFYFVDYTTKLNYQLNNKNHFSVSGIVIENQLDYTSSKNNDNIFNTDLLKITNRGLSFDWHKKWTKKITQYSIISSSKYFLNYNLLESNKQLPDSNFDKRNIIYDTNFLTEFTFQSKNNKFSTGYQYAFKDVSYAFINTKNSEYILDYDQKRNKTHAFFSNYRYKNAEFIDFNLGFRLNFYTDFNQVRFEPRILISKKLNSRLSLQSTFEIKNQIISQIDETVLSDLSLENRLWHLSNNNQFPIVNSQQITFGAIYKHNNWTVDFDLALV